MKQSAILDKTRTPWGTKYRTTVSIRGIKHWNRALTTYTPEMRQTWSASGESSVRIKCVRPIYRSIKDQYYII